MSKTRRSALLTACRYLCAAAFTLAARDVSEARVPVSSNEVLPLLSLLNSLVGELE
jgi:hypothetical protein